MNKKIISIIFIFICSILLPSCSKKTSIVSTEVKDEYYIDAVEASDFRVSKVFTDNMVLQRNERIRIYGFANESENGKKVTADFMGLHSEGLIEDSKWEIVFTHGLKESTEGSNLVVKASDKIVSFEDVLVGDVFMVIGQSNVAYSMNNYFIYSSEIKKSDINNDAPIRINYNSLSQDPGDYERGSDKVLEEPLSKDYLGWEKASLDSILKFSAYGYLFAYNYLSFTNNSIPVGLIEIDGNGQPLGSFLPNRVAELTRSDYFDDFAGFYIPDGLNAMYARYLYNEFMYPFEKYPINGVIWYQGESDLPQYSMQEYQKRFIQLIKHMRGTHNLDNKNFNVYITEFPSIYDAPIGYDGENQWQFLDTGAIRAVVSAIPSGLLENSYLVQSSDLWNDKEYWNNLHPNCKYNQALRLAKIVASINSSTFNLDEVEGPIVKSIKYNKDYTKATITYNYVGDGLKTTDNSKIVKGFMGLSREFTPNLEVEAKIISKNTIEITSSEPLFGVAYNVNASNYFGIDITLSDSYQNPAGAFMLNR